MSIDLDQALGRLLREARRQKRADVSSAIHKAINPYLTPRTYKEVIHNEAAIIRALAEEPLRAEVLALMRSLDASDDPVWSQCKYSLGF